MPPRWVVAGIVAFWLGMAGWLFHRDLWPNLRPGEPPPFVIDSAYEARLDRPHGPWDVSLNGRPGYRLFHTVEYFEEDDTFKLHARLESRPKAPGAPEPAGAPFRDVAMHSFYHVTRQGEVRAVGVEARFQVGDGEESVPVEVVLEGEPHGGRLALRSRLAFPGLGADLLPGGRERQLPPVEVSRRGIVLNPLHPQGRLPGLRDGQAWRVPGIDPLGRGALAAAVLQEPGQRRLLEEVFPSGQGVEVLRAEVRAGTHVLTWRGKEVACRQVKYAGTTMEVVAWVRATDGLVLRQEVTLWNDRWVLEREQDW